MWLLTEVKGEDPYFPALTPSGGGLAFSSLNLVGKGQPM